MTIKQIDTYYLLEEIEILTGAVTHLADMTGYAGLMKREKRDESAVRLVALLDELQRRKDWRLRTTQRPPKEDAGNKDGLNNIDYLLDALRVLPSPENMAHILTAHEIERAAKEQRIAEKLIHTAMATTPVRVSRSPGQLEDGVESWLPFLPEDLRAQWENTIESIAAKYSAMSPGNLLAAYETYLNDVLNAYATDSRHAAAYWNELDEEAMREQNSSSPIFKDTFWRRSAKLVRNRDHRPSEPWHAASKTVDNTPRNAPYLIEIVFEPRRLAALRAECDLVLYSAKEIEVVFSRSFTDLYDIVLKNDDLPKEPILRVDGKFAELLKDPDAWLATLSTPAGKVFGIGRSKTAAMVSLAAPGGPPSKSTESWQRWYHPDLLLRAMTLEEKEGLSRVASDPTVGQSYSLEIKTTDGRLRMHLKTKEEQLVKGRMLAGLAELRGFAVPKDILSTDRLIYYSVPYSRKELTTVFGYIFEDME